MVDKLPDTRTLINESKQFLTQEIDFKDQEAFKAYKAKHKMRPSTTVTIGGKETTVGDASKEDTSKEKPKVKFKDRDDAYDKLDLHSNNVREFVNDLQNPDPDSKEMKIYKEFWKKAREIGEELEDGGDDWGPEKGYVKAAKELAKKYPKTFKDISNDLDISSAAVDHVDKK